MTAARIRIQHPRRMYPTVQVFLDLELISESDAHRDDVQVIAAHLIAHADDIAHAAYPAAAVRRLTAEAFS